MQPLVREHCTYRFGEFRLDSGSRVLLRANEPVRVPLKAIEILLMLVKHSGDVVTKEEIMTAVWPGKVVDDANLKQNIAVIRKSLAIAPGMPGYIETFVGRGYRIIGAGIEAEPQPPPSSTPAETELPTHLPRFSWSVRILALILVCGASALAFGLWRSRAVPSPSTVSRVTPVTRLPGAESQPAVAPDGKRIAFVWQQRSGKPPAIWVKSLDREDPVRVGTRQGRHASPAWSPDGQSIAYLWIGTDYVEVLLAKADGSGEHVLTRFPHSSYIFRQRLLDWSPDGRWLCLSHAEDPKHNATLFVIDSTSGLSRRLTEAEQISGNDMSPRFSPDGKTVSYIRHIGRTEQELRIVPFRGGAPRKLISEAKRITGQDWDREGKSIVFASDRTGEFRLWRIPAGANPPAPRALDIFSEYPLDISIARHASVLVYSFEAEDRDIWRLDLKEKSWERLIASSAQDASPQYSPDGSHICFRSNRSGEDQLWVADSNGEHPVQVTKGALSPNFRPLVFRRPLHCIQRPCLRSQHRGMGRRKVGDSQIGYHRQPSGFFEGRKVAVRRNTFGHLEDPP